MSNPKKIIGILGGIGSGKSSVAYEFEKLGCAVISADKIAKDLLADEQIKSSIIEAFGTGVLDTKNEINRIKISEIIFSSPKNVETINGILHPSILSQTNSLIEQYNQDGTIKAIILDMPLLLEIGWQNKCDCLIFVDSREDLRDERVLRNYPENAKNLKKRENFQISLDKKADIAHYTIVNNSDLKALAEQVSRIFSIIIDK